MISKNHCITISIHNISSFFRYSRVESRDHFSSRLPKNHSINFSFPEFVLACKKSSLLHLFIFVIQSILDFRDKTVHTYFWTWPPENNFDQFFIFVSLLQHAKNRLIPSAHSSDTIFQSPIIRLATPIFDHTHPINLQSPFNLREFVPASKTQLISSFHFWEQFLGLRDQIDQFILDHDHPKNFDNF